MYHSRTIVCEVHHWRDEQRVSHHELLVDVGHVSLLRELEEQGADEGGAGQGGGVRQGVHVRGQAVSKIYNLGCFVSALNLQDSRLQNL